MNEKQRRFAQEYSVDHNATAAAVRAGYAESRARQTGHEMLQKPDVKQLVAKLDSEKRAELGIDGKDALEPTISGSEAGRQLGISPQRIYQLVGQIRHRIEQAQPPNGAAPWLPQDPTAVPSLLKTRGMGR